MTVKETNLGRVHWKGLIGVQTGAIESRRRVLGEGGLDWTTGARTTVLAWALGPRQEPKYSPWDEGLREGCPAWPQKEGRSSLG